MNRVRITKRVVDRLKYDLDGQSAKILFDIEIRGLGVRIYPTGRKSFVLRYTTPEKRRRTEKLGDYGELTVKEARERALELLRKVMSGEHEPTVERKTVLLKDFADTYIDDHAKPHKKSWKDDDYRLQKHVKPFLGNLPIASIRRPDVSSLHRKIGRSSPYEANRVLALIRVMFNKAVEWGLLPDHHPNPAYNITKFKEVKRDRFVTHEEMPKLLEAISQVDNVHVRTALWLYLLTGMRKTELLMLKWENVNIKERTLRLDETKANRPHVVPLSSVAVKLLEELPKLKDNPFVFPGRNPGKPLTTFNKTWRAVREKAELVDIRLHDLRRTVGSWLAMDGESLVMIGKILNHSNPSTTKIYARLTDNSARNALEKHATNLINAASGEQSPQQSKQNAQDH